MRIFKEMNKHGDDVCPICGTQNDGEVVLVGLVGTQKDGIMEAKQFHVKCIELNFDQEHGIIYQRLIRRG